MPFFHSGFRHKSGAHLDIITITIIRFFLDCGAPCFSFFFFSPALDLGTCSQLALFFSPSLAAAWAGTCGRANILVLGFGKGG